MEELAAWEWYCGQARSDCYQEGPNGRGIPISAPNRTVTDRNVGIPLSGLQWRLLQSVSVAFVPLEVTRRGNRFNQNVRCQMERGGNHSRNKKQYTACIEIIAGVWFRAPLSSPPCLYGTVK